MENQTHNTPTPENKGSKQSLMYLYILLSVLGAALLVLGYLYFDQKKESEAVIARLEEYSSFIEEKRDSLETELKGIIVQYDSLRTNNDTLNLQLEEQQDKIERLLRLRMSDAEKIRKYEKELGTIRKVLRSYIVQIDSLNTRNQILTAENIQLKTRASEVENKNVKLSQEKEQLESITEEAKSLIAANIDPVPLNQRSKENDKVRKVEKIRVDFTVRKNSVADPGPKMIYLRIVRPDEVTLSSDQAGTLIVQGTEIPYSAQREIIYENEDLPVSIFWDNTGDLIAGNYKVNLYAEGKLIGESEFILK